MATMTGGGFFCRSISLSGDRDARKSDDEKSDAPTAMPSPQPPRLLRVAVGSSNPSKLIAVRQALERALRHHRPRPSATAESPRNQSSETDATIREHVKLDVQGFDVESGVAHQPFGDDETKRGATNRCRSAFRAYKEKEGVLPHLAIGMEGGLEWLLSSGSNGTSTQQQHQKELYCMAWMAVYGRRTGFLVDLFAAPSTTSYTGDKKPIFGFSKTAAFPMPEPITRLIQTGMELGDADDRVFRRHQSKRGSGTVGILTDGLIDRSAYYDHALQLALIPWVRPDLYPHGIQ